VENRCVDVASVSVALVLAEGLAVVGGEDPDGVVAVARLVDLAAGALQDVVQPADGGQVGAALAVTVNSGGAEYSWTSMKWR
jgi:hypothetical protein